MRGDGSRTFGRPEVLLEFSDGDKCEPNPSLKYRTEVRMVCDPSGAGKDPRFVTLNEKDCVLHLEWHTAAACPMPSILRRDL